VAYRKVASQLQVGDANNALRIKHLKQALLVRMLSWPSKEIL
jgi:hypothetical protein